jgi:hypothetical protein
MVFTLLLQVVGTFFRFLFLIPVGGIDPGGLFNPDGNIGSVWMLLALVGW